MARAHRPAPFRPIVEEFENRITPTTYLTGIALSAGPVQDNVFGVGDKDSTITATVYTIVGGRVGASAVGGSVNFTQGVTGHGGETLLNGQVQHLTILNNNNGLNTITATYTGASSYDIATGQQDTWLSSSASVVIDTAPLTLATSQLPTGRVGSAYSQTLAVTNPNGAAVEIYTATGLPPGLSVDASGTLRGTPATAGSYTVHLSVSERPGNGSNPRSGAFIFPLTISPAPTISVSPPMLPAGQVGVPYSAAYTATGGVAPYTFTAVMPFGLVVHPNGTVTGTPTSSGSTSVIVHVTDAAGHSADFGTDIQVNPAPLPPIIPPVPVTISVTPPTLPVGQLGVAYTAAYTATGGTPPYTFTAAMPYGLVLHPDGTVTGTPNGTGDTPLKVHVVDAAGNATDFGTDIDIQAPQQPQQRQQQPPTNRPRLAASGTAAGTAATAWLLNADGSTRFQVQPYGPDFTGGVRVAVGDVDGDGTPDLVTAPGPGGGPDVRVFSGTDGHPLGDFMAFEPTFLGGLYVAAADMNGDGKAEIVVSPDQSGGPRVRVLGGPDGSTVLADFFGIDDPNFRGGVRVAVGDVTGDGVPDLVVAAGFGGGPRVTVYDGATVVASAGGTPAGGQLANFFAFEDTLRNGTYVAAGDLNGDGYADLVFGGGPGGGPRILGWDGHQLVAAGSASPTVLLNMFAFDPSTRDGVLVAVGDANGDGWGDVYAGPGGLGGHTLVFTGPNFPPTGGQPVGSAGGSFTASELLPPHSKPTVIVPPPPPPPPSDPPQLSAIPDATLSAGQSLTDAFTVTKNVAPDAQAQVAATTDNPGLLASVRVVAAGGPGAYTLLGTPVTGQSGTARVTVTATDPDGQSTSETITVTVPKSTQPSIVGTYRADYSGLIKSDGKVGTVTYTPVSGKVTMTITAAPRFNPAQGDESDYQLSGTVTIDNVTGPLQLLTAVTGSWDALNRGFHIGNSNADDSISVYIEGTVAKDGTFPSRVSAIHGGIGQLIGSHDGIHAEQDDVAVTFVKVS